MYAQNPQFGNFAQQKQEPIRILIDGTFEEQQRKGFELFQRLTTGGLANYGQPQAQVTLALPNGTPVNPSRCMVQQNWPAVTSYVANATPIHIVVDGDEAFHAAAVEYAADKKELEETQARLMALHRKMNPSIPVNAVPSQTGFGVSPIAFQQQPLSPQERAEQTLDTSAGAFYNQVVHIPLTHASNTGLDVPTIIAFLAAMTNQCLVEHINDNGSFTLSGKISDWREVIEKKTVRDILGIVYEEARPDPQS